MNWQPIATAPKDRRILLWFPVGAASYISAASIGSWNADQHAKHPKPYWASERGRLFGVVAMRRNPPTHWCEVTPPDEASAASR